MVNESKYGRVYSERSALFFLSFFSEEECSLCWLGMKNERKEVGRQSLRFPSGYFGLAKEPGKKSDKSVGTLDGGRENRR